MNCRKFISASLFLVGLFTFSAFAQNTENNSAKEESTKSRSVSGAIDTSAFDKRIDDAKADFNAQPKSKKAKNLLAAAYFERAFALTESAQYRSALGDFRKGLKLDPNNKEAKDIHDQIIAIFESIGREPPKEGEEPPPRPFKKEQ